VDDTEYFAARERAERALANEAPNAKARDIHLALAEKHAALAAGKAETAENESDLSGPSPRRGVMPAMARML
jgi:hypothetical protein